MSILDKLSESLNEDSDNNQPEPESASDESIDINFSELGRSLKSLGSNRFTEYILLVPLLFSAWWIRTRNLPLLDNKYLLGLDPYYYLRISKMIIDNGSLPNWDYMRLAPEGWGLSADLFVYILVYWYKFLHLLSPAVTQIQAHIWYPAAFGVIGFFFFYLMTKEIFDKKIALMSTAIFVVIPTYLYRTTAGFADHEAAAMPFMFVSLWLFVKAIRSDNLKDGLIYASLSGLMAASLGFTWGAFPILTIPISIFMIFKVVSEKITLNEIKYFTVWNIIFAGIFILFGGIGIIRNISIALTLAVTALFYIDLFVQKYLKVEYKSYKIKGIISVIILGVLGIILNAFARIIDVTQFIAEVLSPAETTGRVAKTISEIIGSTHFWGNFKWPLIMAVIGFIIIIYLTQKEGNFRYVTTGISAILLSYWAFVSITTRTSLIIFILFNIFIISLAYFRRIKSDQETLLLLAIMIGFNIYLASTAARFLFTLSPFIALLAGIGIIKIADILWDNKNKELRILSIVIVLIFAYMIFTMGYGSSQGVAWSGSGLTGQWEGAMTWIRDNTDENDVVTHWWDYGYWTQTVGERPSTHDGGTHAEDSLQLLGRYAMTGIDDDNVYTYLKTKNVSYLLYSREEIGKYHAFSFIGSESNENLDRESTIGIFSLAAREEIRGGERLAYQGTWVLDKDIIINRQVLPEGQSAIVGLTLIKEGDTYKNPQALIYSGDKQFSADLSCLELNGKRIKFNTDAIFPGCVSFIPVVSSNNQLISDGALLFTSDKVQDGLFARLYLFDTKVEGFTEVYNDGTPLALYQGRLIGPIKIWEVNVPEGTETREEWAI